MSVICFLNEKMSMVFIEIPKSKVPTRINIQILFPLDFHTQKNAYQSVRLEQIIFAQLFTTFHDYK